MVNGVGNVALMQRINRVKVLEYIRKNGPAARTEISKNTSLSLSSITNIINFLLSKGLVFQVGPVSSQSVGRKASLIAFNASAMELIAVNVETDEAEIALTDLSGKALSCRRVSLQGHKDSHAVLSLLEAEIRSLLPEAKNPQAIGIAVNGHVVAGSGVVISSIMRWKAVDVKAYFQKKFDLHVYVTNNTKTKAQWQIGEYGAQVAQNLVFLDLTQGVGIISFYGGKINESVAGELGHTTVMKDGPQCFCGNRGCLELVCSVDYILTQCRKARAAGKCLWMEDPEKLDFAAAVRAFEAGDAEVADIFRECAEYLGIGLANIISIFEPSLIVINDDQLTRCDFIYQVARAEAERRAYNMFTRPVEYERVNVTSSQALTGVAQYVADRLFDLDGPDNIL